MPNRRIFVQRSVSVLMLAASPGLRAAVESLDNPPALPLHKVLFDARDEASSRFAAAFAQQGVEVYAVKNGDITPFWRNELAAVWARSPVPVAGLTDANVLFCLEQLGRQHGLRVVHREARDEGMVAWVVAPG
jgi:hypothetical protein